MSVVVRTMDRVLTVLLCVALALFGLVMTLFGRLLGMASDVCTESRFRCSFTPIAAGTLVAAFAPLLIAAVTIVLLLVFRHRWRSVLPLAAAGAAAAVGVVWLGQALIDAGIGRG